MKLKKAEWRNFFSYGNRKQELVFKDENSLVQVSGKNGDGKCFSGNTKITISVTDETLKKLESSSNSKR